MSLGASLQDGHQLEHLSPEPVAKTEPGPAFSVSVVGWLLRSRRQRVTVVLIVILIQLEAPERREAYPFTSDSELESSQ